MTRLLILLPLLSLCAAGCSSSPYAPTNIGNSATLNNNSTIANSAIKTAIANEELRGTNAATSAIQTAGGAPATRVFTSMVTNNPLNPLNRGAAYQNTQAAAIASRYSNAHFAQANKGYATAPYVNVATPPNTAYTNSSDTYVYVAAGPGMRSSVPVATIHPLVPMGAGAAKPWDFSWLVHKSPDAEKVAGWVTDANGDLEIDNQPGPHLVNKSTIQTTPGTVNPPGTNSPAGVAGPQPAPTPAASPAANP